eukprot:CAMPEP_0114658738 /NCGR_PEP_ID=MMETSP0191-20121206/16314_1 /TAXON_ID=126664 /ORGANISM="Sorites sp." /LENGTH=153 /DNA_ID=CAMNT_0001881593 /DNA_START=669 /DNA_END=1130 /DNA_ORIENTATION=-
MNRLEIDRLEQRRGAVQNVRNDRLQPLTLNRNPLNLANMNDVFSNNNNNNTDNNNTSISSNNSNESNISSNESSNIISNDNDPLSITSTQRAINAALKRFETSQISENNDDDDIKSDNNPLRIESRINDNDNNNSISPLNSPLSPLSQNTNSI